MVWVAGGGIVTRGSEGHNPLRGWTGGGGRTQGSRADAATVGLDSSSPLGLLMCMALLRRAVLRTAGWGWAGGLPVGWSWTVQAQRACGCARRDGWVRFLLKRGDAHSQGHPRPVGTAGRLVRRPGGLGAAKSDEEHPPRAQMDTDGTEPESKNRHGQAAHASGTRWDSGVVKTPSGGRRLNRAGVRIRSSPQPAARSPPQ